MKIWAILKDSFYETIDFKLFYVLIGLSLLVAVGCLSFTFPSLGEERAVAKNLGDQAGPQHSHLAETHRDFPYGGAAVDIREFRKVADSESTARYRFVMSPREKRQFGRAIQYAASERLQTETPFGLLFGSSPKPKLLEKPEDWNAAIEGHLKRIRGMSNPKVLSQDSDGQKSPERIEVEVDINWNQLKFTRQMGILFGLWTTDLEFGVGGMVFILQTALVEYMAGWAGLIVCIIVTAGFVPHMLQKGTVDLLLVKPMHRSSLLVSKYFGGLLFVFFNGMVLVTSTWAAFAVNTGNWSPWYLASILILIFYFAILYSLSTLMGVLTRSTMVAILVTIAFWFFLFIINQLYTMTHMKEGGVRPEELTGAPAVLIKILEWIHFLLPKPGTLSQLNQQMLLKANEATELVRLQQRFRTVDISWTETISTSAAFIVAMLGLSCWRFSKRDF